MAEPVADDLGLEIVDVVYTNVQGRWILRIFIDKPGGVMIDDCSSLSRELGTILDVEEIIPRRYSLEVSSPGLDRVLNNEKDFIRFAGKEVQIRTKEALEGRKNFKATLAGVEDGSVVLTDAEGGRWVIALGNIERANLVIEV
jgi:ribosome maturation factor RimP